MRRHSPASIVMVLAAQVAGANDLKELYDLALTRDAALQAAGFQRARPGPQPAQSFYDATEQSVIDAQNALDDAHLALTEIVGEHSAAIAPLRQEIPLVAPEPPSADEWVASARQDNFDVRTAQLKMEAASRDISAQRGRGLPTIALAGSSSKISRTKCWGAIKRWIRWACRSAGPCFRAARLLSGAAIARTVPGSSSILRRGGARYRAANAGCFSRHQRIEVCDRGSGMSQTVLAQALLPFYSTKRSGTGLGLALAR
jgi:hypothetical protein